MVTKPENKNKIEINELRTMIREAIADIAFPVKNSKKSTKAAPKDLTESKALRALIEQYVADAMGTDASKMQVAKSSGKIEQAKNKTAMLARDYKVLVDSGLDLDPEVQKQIQATLQALQLSGRALQQAWVTLNKKSIGSGKL